MVTKICMLALKRCFTVVMNNHEGNNLHTFASLQEAVALAMLINMWFTETPDGLFDTSTNHNFLITWKHH